MNQNIKNSIIILTRDRKKLLNQCLNSLYKNISFTEFEIILIDNGSRDDNTRFLKRHKAVKFIKLPHNIGVSAGRNIGVSNTQGKYIIFLDDDTIVEDDPFFKITKFMDKNKEIGIVGPKLLYSNNKIQESIRKFPTPLSVFWRGTFLGKILPNMSFYKDHLLRDFNHKEIKEVDWVLGACQIIRKEVFNAIGYLDEKYFYGYEDIDFCYRAKNAGWKIVYYPYSKIIHYYRRESAKRFISKNKIDHVKGIIRFFYKKYFKIGL